MMREIIILGLSSILAIGFVTLPNRDLDSFVIFGTAWAIQMVMLISFSLIEKNKLKLTHKTGVDKNG